MEGEGEERGRREREEGRRERGEGRREEGERRGRRGSTQVFQFIREPLRTITLTGLVFLNWTLTGDAGGLSS